VTLANALVISLMVMFVGIGTVRAQSTEVVARAASVTGRALLLGNGSAPFALTTGYILNPGDRIDTHGGGRVVIDLSDGSMVVVAPESIVILKDFRAAGSLRELFEIAGGMVRVKINHLAGKPNPYRMNSPTASIAVRGTGFSINVDARGTTRVVVDEGAVEVSSLIDPHRKVLIEAGRGVLVQPGRDFHPIAARRLGGAVPLDRAGRPRPAAGSGGRVSSVSRSSKIIPHCSAVCDNACGIAKIDRGSPPPQSSPNLGVQVGIGLETDAQAGFNSLSRFARSKRSIMSGVRGCWALNSS
jgi:FecR protein